MYKIIKIIVELTGNGKHINYYVDTKADRECYTENTVPHSIIYMMNRKRPVYHEKRPDKELFVYD